MASSETFPFAAFVGPENYLESLFNLAIEVLGTLALPYLSYFCCLESLVLS